MSDAPFVLTFRVENRTLRVLNGDHFESRCDNSIRILNDLIETAPDRFDGRSGYVNFFDMPPAFPHRDGFDLHFCSTRWQDSRSEFLPFPCANSLAWPEVGIPDGHALVDDLLAFQSAPRDERIFWIGANTHPSRSSLAQLAARHPRAIDAELMEWNRDTRAVRLESKTRYVSVWDHRHYKYLIDCPGTGYSGRLRWLMASGRPVFIVDRPAIEHWHARMRPWVHFIPVRPDLSDLMIAYKRLESDPLLYRMISDNARQFVRDHLVRGREIAHIAAMIPAAPAESPLQSSSNCSSPS